MNASQWASLRKQPDKVKKMLSALHMSPAYLKVSWSELDEGDQRKVSNWIAKNGSGWFEKGEQVSTPKGIKNVAPKHRKAAVKRESEGVLRKPMKKEKTVLTERREPWQMTKQEWLDENLIKSGQESRKKHVGNLTLKQWKLNEHKGYVGQAIRDGKPVPERVLNEYPELIITKKETPVPVTKPKDNGEERAYKNYGLVWDGDTSRQDVTSIDYYRVEPNPPKDVSYQGSKSFHGDSAALYFSKSNKETYILPRDSKEYLIHLRNEKVEQDSWSARAKKAGIDLEGLYIDDTDGIRFRMMDGVFKGKTAFRCPEDYRGLVFNSDSKLACGEHGSLTSSDKAIDLRKIGTDDKTTKWAEQQFKSWLSEAKQEGFNTVAEYVDSLKGKSGDNGYAKYAELGRGLEATFITRAKWISKEIDEGLFKKLSDRIDEAYKEFDTTGGIKEYQEAYNSEYVKYYNALPEADKKQIDSKIYGLSNYIHEKKLAAEKKNKEEKKQEQFRFNKTTYALYLKTYPYAMAYFMNYAVHLPKADPQNLTDKELDLINEVVAEGYDLISDTGVYTVEWFKERDELEREREKEYEAEQAKEKQEKPVNKTYFKIIQAVPWRDNTDKKTIKIPIEKPHPFTYKEIEFVSHIEKPDWHVTEATTGLKFAVGKTQQQAESEAKELVDKQGAQRVMDKIKEARKTLELE